MGDTLWNRESGWRSHHRILALLRTRSGRRTGGLISADSLRFLATLSSCWPLFTFNAGFFAFEKPLSEEDELIRILDGRFHVQPKL